MSSQTTAPYAQRAILASALKLTEHARQSFIAEVAHGTDPEKMMDPAFWAHVASRLRVRDHIEVYPESNEWVAELIVVDVGRAYARVRLRRFDDLTGKRTEQSEPLPEAAEGFSIGFVPGAKWYVMRRSDKSLLFRDLPSKDAAEGKLREHVKPLAA